MLVIRSGLDFPAATGEWVVLPPDVKFQEAEWMGMFDAFEGPEKAFSYLSRYCGALPEKYEPTFISSITWSGGRLATPYIPDGHAAGAAFSYLPGGFERRSDKAVVATVERSASAAVDSTTTFGFELDLDGPAKKDKPFAQPFYLRLTTGKNRKKPQKSGRRLSVTLPPGEQQLIRVSSIPTKPLDLFAQVQNAFEAKQEAFLVQPHTEAELGMANWSQMRDLTSLFAEAISNGQFWPLDSSEESLFGPCRAEAARAAGKGPKGQAGIQVHRQHVRRSAGYRRHRHGPARPRSAGPPSKHRSN